MSLSAPFSISLTPEEVREKLGALKKELTRKEEAGELFAVERDHGMEQILGGKELYPSIEEKAAHLFYFVVKRSPFFRRQQTERCASLPRIFAKEQRAVEERPHGKNQ